MALTASRTPGAASGGARLRLHTALDQAERPGPLHVIHRSSPAHKRREGQNEGGLRCSNAYHTSIGVVTANRPNALSQSTVRVLFVSLTRRASRAYLDALMIGKQDDSGWSDPADGASGAGRRHRARRHRLGRDRACVGEVCLQHAMTATRRSHDPSYAGRYHFTFRISAMSASTTRTSRPSTSRRRGRARRRAAHRRHAASNYRATRNLEAWLKSRAVMGFLASTPAALNR